jgi:hypothetical protein
LLEPEVLNSLAAKKFGKGAEKYVMVISGMDLMSMDLRPSDNGYAFGHLTNPRLFLIAFR